MLRIVKRLIDKSKINGTQESGPIKENGTLKISVFAGCAQLSATCLKSVNAKDFGRRLLVAFLEDISDEFALLLIKENGFR